MSTTDPPESRPTGGSGGPVVATAWDEAAGRHAGKLAVEWETGGWTYAELAELVDRLAGRLRAAGLRTSEPVAVCLGQRRYWPVAMLAVAKAGGIYLPLDVDSPAARRRTMVGLAGAELMVVDSPETAENFNGRSVPVEAADVPGASPAPDAGGPLALLFTSGSTGTPKGVPLDHAGVLNEVRAIAGLAGLTVADRALQFSSPGFDASIEEILMCLLGGATLVPRPDGALADFGMFTDFVVRTGITVLDLPTAFWAAWCGWLRETGGVIPTAVRVTIVGGERLSAVALADWQAIGGRKRRLLNTYGPTEASIVATCQVIDGGWDEPGDPPIGRPMENTVARVDSPDSDGWGELWIGGIGVGQGYWRDDDKAAKSFFQIDGLRWYRTGDRARWDARQRLMFGGRNDEQMKIRGHRVEVGEVIRALEDHPAVGAAQAGAIAKEQGGALAAWVKWRGDPPADWVRELREHLGRRLPTAAVPVRWALVERFELTDRGKLDRAKLPEPQVLRDPSARPATDSERRLATIWEELLGLEDVGREDDFFELGGSSLHALRLFSLIAAEFGVRLPMAELLRTPRLVGLAAAVDRCGGDLAGDGLPAVPLRGAKLDRPLFCVHGGDGGALFYRNLAERLPPSVELWALESPLLSQDKAVAAVTVEELAALYLRAVRALQPAGPYRLAGYSFGGVMAFEMARQLIAAGERVAFLGLFDTENPAAPSRRYPPHERLAVFWRGHAAQPGSVRCRRLLERIADGVSTHLRVRAELREAARPGASAPHSRTRMLQVREAHAAAMGDYRPPRIPTAAVLFRTRAVRDKFELPSDYGWSDVTDTLEVIEVPGRHLTMFDERHVDGLVEALEPRV